MVEMLNEQELEQIIKDKWTNSFRLGYVTVKDCMLPELFLEVQKEIEELEVFDDDIWVCSFPRTGTTWTSEMVWSLMNNLDFEKGKTSLGKRVKFLDLCFLLSPTERSSGGLNDPISDIRSEPRPRIIKTHLPFQLLPKRIQEGQNCPKIVYIYRNPIDTCVSYFHHASAVIFSGNLEEYSQLFLVGKVVYGDFFKHIISYWETRNHSNIFFLRYEHMKQNLSMEIERTAAFLIKKLSNDEVTKLQQHLSFESMKNNPAVNNLRVREDKNVKSTFIRTGIVGGYKTEMPSNYVDLFEKWFKDHREKLEIPF